MANSFQPGIVTREKKMKVSKVLLDTTTDAGMNAGVKETFIYCWGE